MIGIDNVVFTRTDAEWVLSFVFDLKNPENDIIEPLSYLTYHRVILKLKEIVPGRCISVEQHDWHEWAQSDAAYTITLKFDNEADEAEFIMKVLSDA